jgi:hypothetical protein
MENVKMKTENEKLFITEKLSPLDFYKVVKMKEKMNWSKIDVVKPLKK